MSTEKYRDTAGLMLKLFVDHIHYSICNLSIE